MDDRTRPAIRLADLPELATRVGVHGSAAQVELGGGACFGIAIATITATQMPLTVGRDR